MANVSFWSLFSIMLLINILLILNKKLDFSYFIIVLTLMSVSGIIHSLLANQLQLYYYVSKNLTHLYFIFYDIVVYPTFAMLFIRFIPIQKKVKDIIIYNIIWVCFMTLFELLIVKPTGIIVYTGWKIIPDSIVFYGLSYPLVTLYYIKLKEHDVLA